MDLRMRVYAITDDPEAFMKTNGEALRNAGNVVFQRPVSGKEAAKNGSTPVPGFRDPWKGRAMTYGEIGCFEAHASVWRDVKASDVERALILESDVILEKDALIKASEHASTYDVIYLAHKIVSSDAALWTCAYMINSSGTDALMRVLEAMGKDKCAPSDEVLVAACRTGIRVKYMEPQVASPSPTSAENSGTEKSGIVETISPRQFFRHRIIVVTYATDPTHGYHNMLLDTLRLYGVYVRCIGHNDPWKGGDVANGPGGAQKIIETLKELCGDFYRDDDIVIFVDGYDVLANGPPESCMASEIAAGKVICATETTCWPDPSLARDYEKKGYDVFLNSGCYAGLRSKLITFLNLCLANIRSPADDDQLAMTRVFLDTDMVDLDVRGIMFLTMNGKRRGMHYEVEQGHTLCLPLRNRPFALHFNGPEDTKALIPDHYSRAYHSALHGVVYRDVICERKVKDRVVLVFSDNVAHWARRALEDPGSINASDCVVLRNGPRIVVSDVLEACNADVLVVAREDSDISVVSRLVLYLGSEIEATCPGGKEGMPSMEAIPPEENYPLPTLNDFEVFATFSHVVLSGKIDPDDPRASAVRSGTSVYAIPDADMHARSCILPHVNNVEIFASETLQNVFSMPLLRPEFCGWLVDRCERHNDWSSGISNKDSRVSGGYENVPTRDVHLKDLGEDVRAAWEDIFKAAAKMSEVLFDGYAPTATLMAFVIKYEAESRFTNFLRPHHDASIVTLNVALNDDYEGGETWFKGLGVVPRRKPGTAILHPGRPTHRHGAMMTTSGTRYVLIGFLA